MNFFGILRKKNGADYAVVKPAHRRSGSREHSGAKGKSILPGQPVHHNNEDKLQGKAKKQTRRDQGKSIMKMIGKHFDVGRKDSDKQGNQPIPRRSPARRDQNTNSAQYLECSADVNQRQAMREN